MTSHNQGLSKTASKPPFWRVKVVILHGFPQAMEFAITMTVPRSYHCQIQTSYCECTSFLHVSVWCTYYHFFACPNLFYGVAFVGRVFYIGLQLIYNVVLVSGIQPSGSVIHVSFTNLFPFKLLQNIEHSSSLCYTVGFSWLHILNIYHLLLGLVIIQSRSWATLRDY